jgi:hypothetical protein
MGFQPIMLSSVCRQRWVQAPTLKMADRSVIMFIVVCSVASFDGLIKTRVSQVASQMGDVRK